jgi:hypothetical protein
MPCTSRIDAVQQALVSVTGISVSDQIVMCQGARLDPAKPLAAYRLPVVRMPLLLMLMPHACYSSVQAIHQ